MNLPTWPLLLLAILKSKSLLDGIRDAENLGMNPNLVSHLNSEMCRHFGNDGSIVGEINQRRTLAIAPAIDSLFTDFLEMESLARTWTDHWPDGFALTAQLDSLSSFPSPSQHDMSPFEASFDDCPPPSHWGINE